MGFICQFDSDAFFLVKHQMYNRCVRSVKYFKFRGINRILNIGWRIALVQFTILLVYSVLDISLIILIVCVYLYVMLLCMCKYLQWLCKRFEIYANIMKLYYLRCVIFYIWVLFFWTPFCLTVFYFLHHLFK